jgi:hypothetical protein
MVATDRIAPPTPPRSGNEAQLKRRRGRGPGRLVAEVAAVLLIIGAMAAWYFLTQPTQRIASRNPVATMEEAEKAASAERLAASRIAEEKAAAERLAASKIAEEKAATERLAASKIAEEKAATERQARIDAQRAREQAEHDAELEKARAAAEFQRKRADIERLLREATADVAADRLTTPVDNNAFSRYRAVLALDPANEAALEGLHDILRRYLVLAKAAVNENSFDLAGGYLDKAAAVSPGAESIAAARSALDKRKAAHEEELLRVESETQQAAEDERQRMQAARRATEEERKRLEAARLAAYE